MRAGPKTPRVPQTARARLEDSAMHQRFPPSLGPPRHDPTSLKPAGTRPVAQRCRSTHDREALSSLAKTFPAASRATMVLSSRVQSRKPTAQGRGHVAHGPKTGEPSAGTGVDTRFAEEEDRLVGGHRSSKTLTVLPLPAAASSHGLGERSMQKAVPLRSRNKPIPNDEGSRCYGSRPWWPRREHSWLLAETNAEAALW
jgi:hypothetical protein